MKTFDYFYENYLVPAVEEFIETFLELGEFLLNTILVSVFVITTPLWIIPYLVIKYIKGSDNNAE